MDQGGWAVLVTVAGDGTLLDRRASIRRRLPVFGAKLRRLRL
jgi:predicted polyphosphate/ATP-dependent NAD kinase